MFFSTLVCCTTLGNNNKYNFYNRISFLQMPISCFSTLTTLICTLLMFNFIMQHLTTALCNPIAAYNTISAFCNTIL